jgi:hypothetical protein
MWPRKIDTSLLDRSVSMSRTLRRAIYFALTLSMAFLLASCGNVNSAPISNLNTISGVSVDISPASISVGTNSVTAFTATVNDSGVQTVQWQVNGIPGGAPIIGTIDSSGNYTAPQFVPNPANVMITAVAYADNTKSGNASVSITGTQYPATVYLSPTGSAYVQVGTKLNLSAGVTGPADTSVEWQVNGVANGNSTVGTIATGANGSAVYTAPTKLPNPSTVTIKALSHTEPTRFNSCPVALSLQPPTIATVTISPVLAIVQGGDNFTFTASVIGANDTSVSWRIDGTPGGDTTFGTIAGVTGDQGRYTAPFKIPNTGSAVPVVAYSNAQPARTTSGLVTIAPPPAFGVSISVSGPINDTVGSSLAYTAALLNTNNQAVTWQVNGITGGNATVGTIVPTQVPDVAMYTAPATVPVPATVVVGAVPSANPKVSGTVPVLISTVPVVVTVVCYPNACPAGTKLGINQQLQYAAEVSGLNDQNASWYVCTQNSQPANCILGGDGTLGTISPDTVADLVTYTAPASVPNPSTIIIKAVPEADPSQFGTTTLTISLSAVSVQVSPPGPFSVPINQSAPPFTAVVTGSTDQTVSWYVNGILNGNSVVGTMVPDSQNLGAEDYIAPANIPNPAAVSVTAVPEAAPTVTSNAVQITIVLPQEMLTISPDPAPPLLPGANEQFSANVQGTQDQIVNWTLSLPPSEGTSCSNPSTPCGTIVPPQTNNVPTTYTAPQNPPTDPYYVNITATSNDNSNLFATVTVEITQNATGSFNIYPSQPTAQAGSANLITFGIDNLINLGDDPTVSWTMSCNSLAPTGENCGKSFGQYQDKGGPGCISYPGDFFPLCNDGGFNQAADLTFTYTAPGVLGSSYQQIEQCNTQPGQTDGYVAITAEIDASNCPNQGRCLATVCIAISPPGAK